jgi:ribonuclease BN (tRNA processing enzyme)
VTLARGADILVHSAFYPQAIDRLVAGVPNARTLVLSHLVPPDDPEVTDQTWIDAARLHFGGAVIVGEDLLEI